jgi:hypothetical protein
MNTAGIQLFQLLKGRMGDRETEALVDYVDSSLKENKKDIQEMNLKSLVTKEDLWATREELKGDIAKAREDFKDVKSDTIRWMFAFFITMMLTILGLYLKQ